MRISEVDAQPVRVLIIDGNCDLLELPKASRVGAPGYDLVICQFWAASETTRRLAQELGASCYALNDIIPDYGEWERGAYERTQAICTEGPRYEGLAWRSYLQEGLYNELLLLIAAGNSIKLVERYSRERQRDSAVINMIVSERARKAFEISWLRSDFKLTFDKPEQAEIRGRAEKGRPARILNRAREVMLTGGLRTQLWHLLAELDRDYSRRIAASKTLARPEVAAGGTTLLSSYVNNSRIIRSFEDRLPGPATWVLTNYSARAGANGTSSPTHWIWRFPGDRAKTQTSDDLKISYTDPTTAVGSVMEEWLAESPVWSGWVRMHLAALVNMTACWEAYLDRARPSLVVTASQWGLEGWFTQVAMSRGIPVLQLMHGVLGGHLYTRTPVVSDGLVTFGQFWKTLWPASEQRKIVSHNPEGYIKKVGSKFGAGRPRLTFFSWPVYNLAHYNGSEFTDQIIHLLNRLIVANACEVTVRAHPAENPYVFVQRWRHLFGRDAALPRISKQEPLSDILEDTDVALMLRSTVMLNCLASGIPVVMPGWIPTGWNEALEAIRAEQQIYLARDFADIENRIRGWLARPPQPRQTGRLLRPAGEGGDEFDAFVRQLCSNSSMRTTAGIREQFSEAITLQQT